MMLKYRWRTYLEKEVLVFRIALNILHIGRIKLGATVIGGMRRAINNSVSYANERKQFNMFLSEFGAIKHKLSEQVIKMFSTESAVYRASKDIQDKIECLIEQGRTYGEANIEGVAEYEPECALLKVYGSESLDYIVVRKWFKYNVEWEFSIRSSCR